MAYALNKVGEYVATLPPRFIQDCFECGVDVGLYTDDGKWVGNQQHLEELISRARFYCDRHGPDAAPPGVKQSAKALLKALSREGLWGVM